MKKLKIYILLPILLFTAGCGTYRLQDESRGEKTFFTVIAAGDAVHPINEGNLEEFKLLGKSIYTPTRELISSGNLSFVNIEGPFSDKRPQKKGLISFANYSGDLDNLIWAGFNCFSLANNHSLDLGDEGVKENLKIFEEKKKAHPSENLIWAGTGRSAKEASKSVTAAIDGVKIGFAAYTDVYNNKGKLLNSFSMSKALKDLKGMKNADLKIISIHHGEEFIHVPSKRTVKNFRKLIDGGADIIIGHHPHVAQGIEYYKSGVIFYSLGNYAMGTLSKRHREHNAKLYSFIGKIRYRKTPAGLLHDSVEIYPLYSDNVYPLLVKGKKLISQRFVPEVLTGEFADYVLSDIEKWSGKIPGNKTVFHRSGDALAVKFQQNPRGGIYAINE